jgi:hypothetical protein
MRASEQLSVRVGVSSWDGEEPDDDPSLCSSSPTGHTPSYRAEKLEQKLGADVSQRIDLESLTAPIELTCLVKREWE